MSNAELALKYAGRRAPRCMSNRWGATDEFIAVVAAPPRGRACENNMIVQAFAPVIEKELTRWSIPALTDQPVSCEALVPVGAKAKPHPKY